MQQGSVLDEKSVSNNGVALLFASVGLRYNVARAILVVGIRLPE